MVFQPPRKSSVELEPSTKGGLKLKWLIIIPFIIQVGCSIGLSAWLAYRQGLSGIEDQAKELLKSSSLNIFTQLENYLLTPALVTATNSQAIELENLNTTQLNQWVPYLIKQSQLFPELNFIYYGDQQGNYIHINRYYSDELYVIRFKDETTNGQFKLVVYDLEGRLIPTPDSIENTLDQSFDPRPRPWYIQALEANEATWTEAYLFLDLKPNFGISHVMPVFNSSNKAVKGVLGADFSLLGINQFLEQLSIGKSGKAFIIENVDSGNLIASSTPYPETGQKRPTVWDIRDPIIQDTANFLESRFGGFNHVNGPQSLSFQSQAGNRYLLSIAPFQTHQGLDWLIIVAIPESDLTPALKKQNLYLGIISVFTWALTVLLGWLTAYIVAQALRKIQQGTIEIAQGNLSLRLDGQSLEEINDLTQSFNLMSQTLVVAQRKSSEALEASRQRHAYMYQKAPVMLHSIDRQGRIRHVSDYWLEKLGYARDEVIGHKSTDFLTPESRHYAETIALPDYFKAGICSDIPYQIVTKDGEVIDVLLSATTHQDNFGQIMSLAVMVDVTASNQELYREKELAQVTLQSIADAVITTDVQGYVEFINPVAEELIGWKAAEAKGLPLTQVFNIINEIKRTPAENPVDQVLRNGQIAGLENHTALISKSGIEYSIEDSAAPIRNRAGDLIGAVMVFHDVTHARQLQIDLSWQASHDSLTGLANRQKFEQELDAALQGLIRDNQVHVFCFLDLDQFKVVNDTCGHPAGDELLRQISQLLKKQIRTVDFLARLGGDEFGILLKQCSLDAAQTVAQKILSAVQDFRFVWQDRMFSIGVSLGLVSLTIESTLTDVLSAADSACYAAKNKGRNRIQVYEPNNLELISQRGERHWSLEIKQALEENRFCLYRQEIVSTTHSHATAYEVLLRMVDNQGNLIVPDVFIPAAERYNLMPAIDRWVIRTFLGYIEQVLAGDESTPDIDADKLHFINLSGDSVGDPLFLEFIKEEFKQHDCPLQNIGFEITETTAISNLQQAAYFIHELKQLGCKFSLDDFGSGMSSFGYLKSLSVDYLKIDGYFVKDIIADPATYAIVESINHVGHVMGLKTIAEYVENRSLRDRLGNMGGDYVQGFGIAKPVPMIPFGRDLSSKSYC